MLAASVAIVLAVAALVLMVARAAGASSAESAIPDKTKLQRALDGVVASGVPGAILLVRTGDETVRLTSGYANLRTKTPIRTSDRFRIGSLTKTFVVLFVNLDEASFTKRVNGALNQVSLTAYCG
jgi:D-alanyl-D-alanine carboxypeptidase